ncbi:hypothetical protein [Streptomyces sp. WMMC940]|uniref:hypothetical protein n=1 Tax=Streptomyces sp. WMMC940 TaxID=3015153 RepID=UPI0022B71FCF|nr:hypothetical protein [Streptomyces sp. WMMC940]MCZ7460752.1 hypothetical protein [Streptomyces sp. WMMC940]
MEQAEAALVEHYPRLVRIAYLVLPPSLGRNRRVLTAHWIVQRSLPRGRAARLPQARQARVPAPRGTAVPGYAFVRGRVLRQALDAGLPLRRRAWPKRVQFPPLLPQVRGLRLFPRSGGADELALDQGLSALSGAARAAYVLRALEGLADAAVRQVLTGAGVADPHAALAAADGLRTPEGRTAVDLLESPEFDPCSLQARPTDLMRRRRQAKAALAAAAAVLVSGTLLSLPGEGWAPAEAAAPLYARHPAAEAALDPARLQRIGAQTWRSSSRTDFSVWPARGSLTGDRALLRRALAVWARPGATVQVSATPGTPPGPPMGAPQLLFAGEVGRARVVLFHDGLRVVRYAEPDEGASGGPALDLARTDSADAATAGALLVDRGRGEVRYLTAPWVSGASARDLLDPDAEPRTLRRDAHGVTEALPSPAEARECRSWHALELAGAGSRRLVTDLGEIVPARLTWGPPLSAGDVPEAPEEARTAWARTACLLPTMRSNGVREVNAWRYTRQWLPEGNGRAAWVCTRAETWRGTGGRVLAQFQPPQSGPAARAPGVVVARSEVSPACGPRDPQVLAGVLWRSRTGRWYVLAAGSEDVASVRTSGGVTGSAAGNHLVVPARQGVRVELDGRLADGSRMRALR